MKMLREQWGSATHTCKVRKSTDFGGPQHTRSQQKVLSKNKATPVTTAPARLC